MSTGFFKIKKIKEIELFFLGHLPLTKCNQKFSLTAKFVTSQTMSTTGYRVGRGLHVCYDPCSRNNILSMKTKKGKLQEYK